MAGRMKDRMKRLVSAGTLAWARPSVPCVLLVGALALAPWPARAQGGSAGAPAEGEIGRGGGVSGPELQRLFDAYALMQAQEALQLSDQQYPRFLAKLRALQEIRRRAQGERARALQQLRQLVRDRRSGADDDRIREALKALREASERTIADIVRAADDIDDVLEPAQQARLRIFEEQMERRKLDLLMRARRGRNGRMRR